MAMCVIFRPDGKHFLSVHYLVIWKKGPPKQLQSVVGCTKLDLPWKMGSPIKLAKPWLAKQNWTLLKKSVENEHK